MSKPLFDIASVFESDDYMYFYQRLYDATQPEIDYLNKFLNFSKKSKVLDLACGFGRHSIELSKLGNEVTAIDISDSFLQIARDEAKKLNLEIEFVEQDMRKISYDSKFDYVLMLFTAFGYFSDLDNELVIEKISNSLKPGGVFCFDILNRDSILLHLKEHNITEREDNFMIDQISFDAKTGHSIYNRIIVRNGQVKHKPFRLRVYNYNEIESILGKYGLMIETVHADWNGCEFESSSPRMIISAKKHT